MSTTNSSDALSGNCSMYNATMLAKLLNNATANRTAEIEFLLSSDCKATVCSLAWGSPDPDLSGIGVCSQLQVCNLIWTNDVSLSQTVISYMVQTGLIALFGLYLIIPGTLAKLGFKYPEKIHRHFRAANFLMAISFFVAEVYHLSQNPGIV